LLNSATGKEDNQTELTLNSLPQMATNLTKRGNETDPTLVFAGMPIFFNKDGVDQGRCMSSFVVVPAEANKLDPNTCIDFGDPRDFGFLSSSLCCKNGDSCGITETNVNGEISVLVGNGNNTQQIGFVGNTMMDNPSYFGGNDFAFLKPLYKYSRVTPYVVGDKQDFYPVTGLGSVTVGSKVCAYGALGGYRCGNVIAMNVVISSGRNMPVDSPVNFAGVNKVDLGDYGFYVEEDLGGPVYAVSNIGEHTTAQALGYISGIDNDDQHHKFIYYTPLDKFFELSSSEQISCPYKLMTYNETNAQEYDQLLAQMEIPTKK
jgi:hypothetical protein